MYHWLLVPDQIKLIDNFKELAVLMVNISSEPLHFTGTNDLNTKIYQQDSQEQIIKKTLLKSYEPGGCKDIIFGIVYVLKEVTPFTSALKSLNAGDMVANALDFVSNRLTVDPS